MLVSVGSSACHGRVTWGSHGSILGFYPTRTCFSKGEAFAVHCHPRAESRFLTTAARRFVELCRRFSFRASLLGSLDHDEFHGSSHCTDSADVLVAEDSGTSLSSKLRYGANACMSCDIDRAKLVPVADCYAEEAPILSLRSQHSLCTLRAGATGHCSSSSRPIANSLNFLS